MLQAMSIPVRTMLEELDRRAAQLDALLDRHPGRHLLAEYEAEFCDREDVLLERVAEDPGLESYVADLLRRMEGMVAALEPDQG